MCQRLISCTYPCGHKSDYYCADPFVSIQCPNLCILLPDIQTQYNVLCNLEDDPDDINSKLMVYTLTCPNGHIFTAKWGYPVPPVECNILVPLTAACGHLAMIECSNVPKVTMDDLAKQCNEKCNTYFFGHDECGHICQGTCGQCFQGRFHIRCQQSCGKINICGHT